MSTKKTITQKSLIVTALRIAQRRWLEDEKLMDNVGDNGLISGPGAKRLAKEFHDYALEAEELIYTLESGGNFFLEED